jgi:hypothetical protein
MLALVMPLVNWLFGGVLQSFFTQWLSYKATVATSQEAGFAAAASADQANLQVVAASEVAIDAQKVSLYGTPTYQLITKLVGIPVSIHFALVFVDTILAAKVFFGHPVIGIPNPPAPYPTYEWAIISSFFLVHMVNIGTGNVARWLKTSK